VKAHGILCACCKSFLNSFSTSSATHKKNPKYANKQTNKIKNQSNCIVNIFGDSCHTFTTSIQICLVELLLLGITYVNLKNDQRCYCSEKIKLFNMMYFALIGRFPIRGYIDKSFYLFLKMYKSLKLFRKKK
jgi:hypothetical protein